MFNQFTHLVSNASGWAYAVVFLLALLDAILPVVPSETAVITAGVLAAAGHLSLPLIVAFAAVGALAGDNIAYFIGWRFGDAVASRFFGGEKGRKRIAWARRQLRQRGAAVSRIRLAARLRLFRLRTATGGSSPRGGRLPSGTSQHMVLRT